MKGKFAGGTNLLFNAANGGVGLGMINKAVPAAIGAKTKAIALHVAHGDDQAADEVLAEPELLDRDVSAGAGLGPPPSISRRSPRRIESPRMEAAARPRAPRDHQAVSGDRRERPHRPRPAARRGARAARRERRRQVDADERPLRPLPSPTRARSCSNGEPVALKSAKDAIDRGIGMVHQHFMLIPVMTVAENIVLANEPTHAGILLDYARRRRRASRELAAQLQVRDRPGRADRRPHGRPAAAGRDPEGALPQGRHPDPRRADRGAHAAGGARAVRDPPQPEGGRDVDHLHHATS